MSAYVTWNLRSTRRKANNFREILKKFPQVLFMFVSFYHVNVNSQKSLQKVWKVLADAKTQSTFCRVEIAKRFQMIH